MGHQEGTGHESTPKEMAEEAGRVPGAEEGIRSKRVTKDEIIEMQNKIIHDLVVANQAAWIEWRHGKGAEAAMTWVHNGLVGPGSIPDENAPWGKEAQAWFDANRADPFPFCYCGRPSHQLWMGKGACCDEHMSEIRKSGGGQH